VEIPGAQLIWVPGGGHALILERPDLVSDAINGLLAKMDAGGLPRSA
jgi:pimeloyl-ACP methyl ester carboxylesterase